MLQQQLLQQQQCKQPGSLLPMQTRHRCRRSVAVTASEKPPSAAATSMEPAAARPQQQQQHAGSSSSSSSGSGGSLSWRALAPTWNPSTRKQLNHLMDLFTLADRDGNGILDRDEVRHLLQSDGRCTSGICLAAQHHWVSESDLDEIMAAYDAAGRGGLTFSEFMELVLDGVLLDGAMDEYRAVFSAADVDGDGSLSLEEMSEVLQQLGRDVSTAEVEQIMRLRLFRGQLLDLPRLLRYMKMKPVVLGDEVPPAAAMSRCLTAGGVTLVSGEAQLRGVIEGLPPGTLVVVMAGLSGDAVCQTTAEAVQELAAVYHRVVFLELHVDASPDNKQLFKHVLLGRYVPAFFFFRGAVLLHSHADANAAVLEAALREHLPATEAPLVPLLTQQQQQGQQDTQRLRQQRAVLAISLGSEDIAAVGDEQQQQQGQQQQEQQQGQQQGQQQQQHQWRHQQSPLTGYSMADIWYNPRGEVSDPSRDWAAPHQ